ncbi:uncharacterized protein LOC135847730 isoform X7 [Planococcus citri]|uniref:uncharacterized protein LOC135847730 isoform X7 n=1 Tax=Planococcus citri TaxID=170843 RepID=UPI0031F7BE9D
MAGKTSKVYDIMHPTPVSLQELSVIAVSLELWRSEIDEYRKSQSLERFRASDNIASLRGKLPELPSVIYDMIVKYVSRLGKSMGDWLKEHSRTVSDFDRHYQSCVLEYFDDFIADYDGNIDFVRTAERMMHCDSFHDVLKFIVACRYYLEDHVRRIWPSVQQKMDLKSISFRTNPLLYYWICNLSNQLNKISRSRYDTVDEDMLVECAAKGHNLSAINHFWSRVPYENQMQAAEHVFRWNIEGFVRCILLKLDDQQLVKFFNEYGRSRYLVGVLLENHSHDERFISRTLMCIKNAMNGSTFSNVVSYILEIMARFFLSSDQQQLEAWSHVGCIIWNSAPHNLKRSAITKISSDLESLICRDDDGIRAIPPEFLLSILTYFTLEETQSFWRRCWKNLILNKNVRNLQRIMKICFEHEDDIIKFKENFITECENLQLRCVSLLFCANFDELDALVNFSCPRSAETAKHLKQRLLQLCFIGERSDFRDAHVVHCEEFDSFINNAYESIDLANDFKHQLVSSPNNSSVVSSCVGTPSVSYEALRKFIETFVSTEQILLQLKSCIIDRLKKNAIRRSSAIKDAYSKPFFDQFLLWCLGSNDQVMEFERTYITPCIDDIP